MTADNLVFEWHCAQVNHHKDIADVIKDAQAKGWELHTYSTAGLSSNYDVAHYLLFKRTKEQK